MRTQGYVNALLVLHISSFYLQVVMLYPSSLWHGQEKNSFYVENMKLSFLHTATHCLVHTSNIPTNPCMHACEYRLKHCMHTCVTPTYNNHPQKIIIAHSRRCPDWLQEFWLSVQHYPPNNHRSFKDLGGLSSLNLCFQSSTPLFTAVTKLHI